ncbi:hypothetical protein VTJ83DRAFT_2602 [Remersonia thermophila]|uniref:Uncharacterized protein n=1 Tax=Remersonia thermophila TaxID=72144 RepID=A0ABR4DJ70_9PEZI
MPKIKSFAPSWLNEPSRGYKLFELPGDDVRPPPSLYNKKSKPGPRRTIARRGTEVFVAVGKQIRWGDLALLRNFWEADQSSRSASPERGKKETADGSPDFNDLSTSDGYRVIKAPVADDIRQLVISPHQDLMAVLTSHTVHICILPDRTHLTAEDASTPLKLKFWTLGPTTHITTRSAVVSALWHPLGVNGTALVTVTEDAVVRVWELSTADRWTFDTATLAIDLKKLADGTSLDQDFSASVTATNKGFSPDAFDMEVAAACFPSRDSGGWSPMTLWLAMTSGDVYALCPLLPQRWAPPPTLIPSLSVSVVARVAAVEDDPDASPEARRLAQQQLDWMSDLDNQEPKLVEGKGFWGEAIEVYSRPSRPGVVPKLQGPFEFDLNPDDEQDDEVELKDIYVIGQKASVEDLMMGEDEEVEDDGNGAGLSLTVICLLSTSGQVKICLDVEGVEAQWLPPRSKLGSKSFAVPPSTPSLLTFQTFDTLKPVEVTPDSWPMFSEDPTSRYAFYVTHPAGITSVSLAPWVFRLESELEGASDAGAEFRIDLLTQGQGSECERIYTQSRGQHALAAATAIKDSDLGHLVLSAGPRGPVALFFDTPEPTTAPKELPASVPDDLDFPAPVTCWEPRPLFHPSEFLDQPSALPAWIDYLKTGRRRPLVQQEVRLSMATLEVFTEGHKVISTEVENINNAVAELFRKCQMLQGELREQIAKASIEKKRVDSITGEDDSDESPVSHNEVVQGRLRLIRQRQEELAERMEKLRRKLGRATSRELSDREKAWAEEVRTLGSHILGSEAAAAAAGGAPSKASTPGKELWRRFDEVKALRESLFAQAEQLQKTREGGDGEGPASPAPGLRIPAEVRRQKMAKVMSLLDRESALMDAVKARIERLSIG